MDHRPLGKSKTVEIDLGGDTVKKYTVYEIRPYDVLHALEGVEAETPLKDLIGDLLPLCSSLTWEDLHGPNALYPSDIEKLYHAFREINAPFLKAANALGLWEKARAVLTAAVGPQMMKAAGDELAGLFAGWSFPATGTPSIMDGAFSSSPSTNSAGGSTTG
jgi:hypothetical protein